MIRRSAPWALLTLCSLAGFLAGQFPSSSPNTGGGSGSGNVTAAGMTKGVIPKASGAKALVDSIISESSGVITIDGALEADSISLGNGTDPGLDISKCGTAPSTPASGFVAHYCESDTPYFLDDNGLKTTTVQPGSPILQNSKSAAYTTVLADAGKHIYHPVGDNNARTFTIDSNANVAYVIGTTLTFVNEINTVTIAITTDTLLLAGTATTGSRSLAAGGIATAIKVTATKWIINGTGLT